MRYFFPSGGIAMSTILPHPDLLELVVLQQTATAIVAVVRPRAASCRCPLCGTSSTHIHSRYMRTVLDLPWHGVPMQLRLHVRRFFCDIPTCPRTIFAERLPDVVAPYARRTTRLDTWFTVVGFALGGEAGARLLQEFGATSSPDTLLRHIQRVPIVGSSPGEAIGVDEFAFRRGKQFGTILVDLTTHRVLDLLPNVEEDTVVTWLRQFPHITVVSRDRGRNFGGAIQRGAPQAYQVADRWHLLHNLGERVEAIMRDHKAALKTPRSTLLEQHAATLGRTTTQDSKGRTEHERQLRLYEQIQEAHARGLSGRAIAKLLGIHPITACKYATMTTPPDRLLLPSGTFRRLAAYVPYIYQRWNDGCRNGAQIHEELRAQGISVSVRTVSRYMTILRAECGATGKWATVAPTATYIPQAPPPPSLTPRQGAILFSKPPDRLTSRQKTQLEQVFARDPALVPLYEVVQAFGQMVRTRGGSHLDAWFLRVEASGNAHLQAFAKSLKKDEA
ncbi:MAG: ISL3 family transposase, partial [Ktedonobacterales bacterium]|nr:ISL3 family transposase [Ktedonobacterales bacterium]